ncbi:MAG TPA: hypothetical protein DEQ02_10525 [Ruminococcaceae bacterium]|nr:hypothetical protein [Oscillospiraceae bacterium]
MKILTFIKPIKTELLYANECDGEKFSVNPYDAKVIVNLSAFKNCQAMELIVAAMGSSASECVLRKALASGMDSAYLLCDNAFAGADTVATSYVLEKAAVRIGADAVFMGQYAVDGETGQTPFGVAERLGYRCVSGVEELREIGNRTLTLKVNVPNGYRIVKVGIPTVVVFSGMTTKKSTYSLLEMKRAKAKRITVLSSHDISADEEFCGIKGSRTRVMNITGDLIKKSGEKIELLPSEAVERVLSLLRDSNV